MPFGKENCTLTLYLQLDWRPLLGVVVEIRHRNRRLRTGTVDAITEDGSILWLGVEGAFCRSMFERADDFEVWAHQDLLENPAHQVD